MLNKRGNDFILLSELMFCHVDACSGITESFTILPVRKAGIIAVFMSDGAMIDFFGAAVTDIRRFLQPATLFFLEIFTGLVTSRAGSAFDSAEDNLATGVGFPAVISVDAEVMCIVESPLVIPV